MMSGRIVMLASSLALLTLATAVAPNQSYGAEGGRPIAIVAAKDFPIDDLSFGDLKRLYMGNSIAIKGKTVVPLTYPRHMAERRSFDAVVLGMSPDEVGRYWIDRKIRGQLGAPKSVDSEDVVIRVVSKLDGSLGFVRADVASRDVKVLKIDGRLPKDPGYRVRQRDLE